jgi:DNA-binding transcriptional LysR family regulator
MRGLNLDHVHAFAEVVRLGTFSAAAERLSLTQPAISLQIGQLEKRLGVKLVERLGRRAMPTAAGQELLDHAVRIDGAVAAALEALAPHASGDSGRLRLATGATASIYPVLRALRQRFPRLEITVTVGNTPEVVRDIEDNRLDLGFVTLPASGRMLEVTPVIDDELVVIGSRDGAPLPAKVTASVLSEVPLITSEVGSNSRLLTDQWFAQARLTCRPIMALGSTESIKELVGAGLGCAVLPRMALQGRGDPPGLVVRSLVPRVHRTLGIVVRRDKVLNRALKEAVRGLIGLGNKRAAK